MTNTNRERGEMMEQFAEMEHTRWARWQSYLHSKCTKNADGSLTIPVESVIHWERQIGTPYSQLTEREKESDRDQVRPYLEVFAQALKDASEEAYQAGLRRAVEAVENWDALEHDSTVGFAWRNLIREKVVSRIQALTALSEEIKK